MKYRRVYSSCISILSLVAIFGVISAGFDPVIAAKDDIAPQAVVYSTGSAATFPSNHVTATRVCVADFNGDGDPDVLYQTAGNGTAFEYSSNNGNGTFAAPVAQSSSPFAGLTLPDHAVANYKPADYDKDGDIDLWVTVASGTGSYFRNDGASFSSQSSTTFPSNHVTSTRVEVADFDNDGDPDVLYQTAGNGTAFEYAAGNGNGTFAAAVAQSSSPFNGLALPDNAVGNYKPADYDKDGDIDLWVAAASAVGSYFRNDGASFSSQSSATFPSNHAAAGRVEVADFDGDGDPDVLYQTAGNGTAFEYKANNGNGTFAAAVAQASSPFSGVTLLDNAVGNYKTADYDEDGDADLWITAASATGSYYIQGSNSGGDGSPPTLLSSIPTDNATGVPVNSNIGINFDESVVKGTGNIRIVRVSDSAVMETIAVGSAQVTGSGTSWVIDPSITLAASTAYAVRFDIGTFADADGAVFLGISNNTTLNFTTRVSTAAPVSIAGRVLTSEGRAISGALVTLTGVGGNTISSRSNPFGYYEFADLEVGTYIVNVSAKRYNFTANSSVFNAFEDITAADFIASP